MMECQTVRVNREGNFGFSNSEFGIRKLEIGMPARLSGRGVSRSHARSSSMGAAYMPPPTSAES